MKKSFNIWALIGYVLAVAISVCGFIFTDMINGIATDTGFLSFIPELVKTFQAFTVAITVYIIIAFIVGKTVKDAVKAKYIKNLSYYVLICMTLLAGIRFLGASVAIIAMCIIPCAAVFIALMFILKPSKGKKIGADDLVKKMVNALGGPVKASEEEEEEEEEDEEEEQTASLDDDTIDEIVDKVVEKVKDVAVLTEEDKNEIIEGVVERLKGLVIVKEVIVEKEVVKEPEEVEEIEEEVADEVEAEVAIAEDEEYSFLKKSFQAKMVLGDAKSKDYYSEIKNALLSYKKVHSTISWKGDRFNHGRSTIARFALSGKTLCLYLALDPNSEDLPSSTFHQKDVSDKKSLEDTPFMFKIKSDLALKRAFRLVEALAQTLGMEKDAKYEKQDYTLDIKRRSIEKLIEEGLIKEATGKKPNFGKK